MRIFLTALVAIAVHPVLAQEVEIPRATEACAIVASYAAGLSKTAEILGGGEVGREPYKAESLDMIRSEVTIEFDNLGRRSTARCLISWGIFNGEALDIAIVDRIEVDGEEVDEMTSALAMGKLNRALQN